MNVRMGCKLKEGILKGPKACVNWRCRGLKVRDSPCRRCRRVKGLVGYKVVSFDFAHAINFGGVSTDLYRCSASSITRKEIFVCACTFFNISVLTSS